MVSDEEVVLMKKMLFAAAFAIMLTGCGNADIQQKASNKPIEAVTQKPDSSESKDEYECFYGVLMDKCCSDIDEPAIHETNCMFMEGCRESGYGLDIEQPDGTWVFYMFDEAGQQQTWDYINTTERQDGLYVTVTGTMENGIIKVKTIKES